MSSNGGRATNQFISPAEYEENGAKIAAARRYLDDLASQNEAGRKRFEEIEAQKRELQRKIQEGEEARLAMEQLQILQANIARPLLEAPRQEPIQSTSRIEEVPMDSVKSPVPQSQPVQRQAPNSVRSPPLQVAHNHPNGNSVQANSQHGSGHSVSSMPGSSTFVHPYPAQHKQPEYPPPIVTLPEPASKPESSHHYQPLRNPNSHYPLPSVQQAYSGGHGNFQQASQAVHAPVAQWGWNNSHHQPGQMSSSAQQQPSIAYVVDKDNSPDLPPLHILPADIPKLRSAISDFARSAPASRKFVLNQEMIVSKDDRSVMWLYIRAPEGFWRYRQIEQFFERLSRSMQPPPPPVQFRPTTVGVAPQRRSPRNTSHQSNVNPPPVAAKPAAVPNTVSHTPTPPPTKLTGVPGGSQLSTNKVAPASASPAPSSVSSSQYTVDKKNLSKHILFALGKRTRDVHQSPEAGPPKKKPVMGTFAAPQTTAPAIAMPNAPQSVAVQPAAPAPVQTVDPKQLQLGTTLPASAATLAASQSSSTGASTSQKQADKDASAASSRVEPAPAPTIPPAPAPAKTTTAQPPSAITTTTPATSAWDSTGAALRTVTYNGNQYRLMSRNGSVAGKMVPLNTAGQPMPPAVPPKRKSPIGQPIPSTAPAPAANNPQPAPPQVPAASSRTTQSALIPPIAFMAPGSASSHQVPEIDLPETQITESLPSVGAHGYADLSTKTRSIVAAQPSVQQTQTAQQRADAGPSSFHSFEVVRPSASLSSVGSHGYAQIATSTPPPIAFQTVPTAPIMVRPSVQPAVQQKVHLGVQQKVQQSVQQTVLQKAPQTVQQTIQQGVRQNVQQNAVAGPSNAVTHRTPPVVPSMGPPPTIPAAKSQPTGGPSSSKAGGKRPNRAYVLAPPRPAYLVAHKRRLAEKRAAHLLGEAGAKAAALEWEKDAAAAGDTSDEPIIVGEDYGSGRNTPVDATEREALRLSATRIEPIPCRWDGCEAVLNCANALFKHLEQHPPERGPTDRYYTCRWTQCGRRCLYGEKHLEHHAYQPLRCAYGSCKETYRSAAQLAKHFRSRHKNSVLKPAAELRRPDLGELPLPEVPGVVPSYLFVTRPVLPAIIPKKRHGQLVCNVVTKIVHSDPEKPARLRASKAARATIGQPFAFADAPPRNEYDFITARSTRYSSYLSQPVDLALSDLDSTHISELLDEGLMLWTPEGGSEADDGFNDGGGVGGGNGALDQSGIKIEDEVQPGLGERAAVSSISGGGQADEEETVESMLTQASG